MDLKDLRRRRNAYVRGRLLSEKADKERGFNARLSEQLKVSTAHVSNWLHKGAGETGDMGERVAKIRWGMEPAELDELAAGAVPAALPRHGTTPSMPAPTRRVEHLPGEARTTDDGRWRDFAAAHPAFLELATVKRGQARAQPQLLSLELVEATLDITSDRLARAYGGAKYTPADVWAEYGRAWTLITTGELPPELPQKVQEPAAPAAVDIHLDEQPPRKSLEEAEDAFQAALRGGATAPPTKAKKGGRRR